MDLRAGEEEGADAVDFGGIGVEFLGVGADGLDVGEFAVGLDAVGQRGPGFEDGGLEFGAIQESLVDAPGEAEGVKGGAAGFLEGIIHRIKQAGPPESIVLLAGEEGLGHFLELPDEFLARRMGGRDIRDDAGEAGDDPAVAAAPEDFLAVGFEFIEVGAVAEIKMVLRRI